MSISKTTYIFTYIKAYIVFRKVRLREVFFTSQPLRKFKQQTSFLLKKQGTAPAPLSNNEQL